MMCFKYETKTDTKKYINKYIHKKQHTFHHVVPYFIFMFNVFVVAVADVRTLHHLINVSA